VTASSSRDANPTLAFHPYRIVVGVGVLLLLGALSLAFVNSSTARPWRLADGVVLLSLVLPIFVLTVIPDRSQPLPRLASLVGAGFLAFALPYAIVKVLDAAVLAGSLSGAAGFGPWLALVAILIVAAGVGLSLRRPGTPPPPPPVARTRSTQQHESPPRRDAARHQRPVVARPPRVGLEDNPFGEPLFDSLEMDEPVIAPYDHEAPEERAAPPRYVFDAEESDPRLPDEPESDESASW